MRAHHGPHVRCMAIQALQRMWWGVGLILLLQLSLPALHAAVAEGPRLLRSG